MDSITENSKIILQTAKDTVESFFKMYEEIDEYSGYEYHESIKNALVGIEFEKYLKNKCYRELLKPKFKNNFRKLPFKSKIYIYLNILKVV